MRPLAAKSIGFFLTLLSITQGLALAAGGKPGQPVRPPPKVISTTNSLGPIRGAWLHPALAYGAASGLGKEGPAGNTSVLISHLRGWHRLSNWLTREGGPLSDHGMFGKPAEQLLALTPSELRAGGQLAIYGPDATWGRGGLNGPLGPEGGHGYEADDQGNFRDDNGRIVRTTRVEVTPGKWVKRDLHELYTEDAVMKLGYRNGTSFSVDLKPTRAAPRLVQLTSPHDQSVFILATPHDMRRAFNIEVFDEQGHPIPGAKSDSFYINHVQLQVAAGQRLQVKVTPGLSNPWGLGPLLAAVPIGAGVRLHVDESESHVAKPHHPRPARREAR